MGFTKKFLILSEITKGYGTTQVKGVVSIERIGTTTRCSIDMFNLKDLTRGIYAIAIGSDDSPIFTQRLGSKGKINTSFAMSSAMSLGDKLYCAFAHILDGEVTPIAWGTNSKKSFWESNIIDGFKQITRPALFVGNVERHIPKETQEIDKEDTTQVRVEPARPYVYENSQVPQTNAIRREMAARGETQREEIAQRNKASNQSSQTYTNKTISEQYAYVSPDIIKPPPSIKASKAIIIKAARVLDQAERGFDDEQIATNNYYPKGLQVQAPKVKTQVAESDYKKAGAVPYELVDGVDEYKKPQIQSAYSQSIFKRSYERPQTSVFSKKEESRSFDSGSRFESNVKVESGSRFESNVKVESGGTKFESTSGKFGAKFESDSSSYESDSPSYERSEVKNTSNYNIEPSYEQAHAEAAAVLEQPKSSPKPKHISSWGGYNNIISTDREGSKMEQSILTEELEQEQKKPPEYYTKIKDEIEEIMQKNAPEDTLNRLLPNTNWVKVKINEDGQYYAMGLIGEDPDYIGYGVPGVYSVNPPKELQGYCQWLPLDRNYPEGEGYWMMYQDADNGESVKLDLLNL